MSGSDFLIGPCVARLALFCGRLLVRTLRTIARRRLARFCEFYDKTLILGCNGRASQGLDKPRRRPLAYLKEALACGDLDGTDLSSGDVAVPTDQRKQPARIGIVTAAGVEAKPTRAFEPCSGRTV